MQRIRGDSPPTPCDRRPPIRGGGDALRHACHGLYRSPPPHAAPFGERGVGRLRVPSQASMPAIQGVRTERNEPLANAAPQCVFKRPNIECRRRLKTARYRDGAHNPGFEWAKHGTSPSLRNVLLMPGKPSVECSMSYSAQPCRPHGRLPLAHGWLRQPIGGSTPHGRLPDSMGGAAEPRGGSAERIGIWAHTTAPVGDMLPVRRRR